MADTDIPEGLSYTEEHEWISMDSDIGTVGITDYAQSQLGDIVFVELPEIGSTFKKGDEAAVVESVKAAAEVYAPISGEIIETNLELENSPGLVNSDALGNGWFFVIKLSVPSELDNLMDRDAYNHFIEELR
mgnify:CR=1 FL=1